MNKLQLLFLSGLTAFLLVGCDSGDINIDPSTTVTDSNNTTNSGAEQSSEELAIANCGSYTNSGGQTVTATYDSSANTCSYPPSFLDAGNNLTVDMTIPEGTHLFEGSLFVGETHDDDAAMVAAGIVEGGDGPTLTIEAGATLAFTSQSQFLIVNRGSQIFAVGTEAKPIVITSASDVNGTLPSFDAVQQWGGVVINGFGITNKCSYTGSESTGDLATTDCHVDAEGAAGLDESQYGGDNNDDSSGRMEYVIVKHTGAQVANGDELNGISFGGVGRNTIIKNLQVYSTYDDGIEMFGGAVNFENFVALYVRDDSIDIDEGYSGTIQNALVIQAANDGDHCIEADGIGSFSSLTEAEVESVIAQGINSAPTINNLTCIVSPNKDGTHSDGHGWRLREGIFPTITNSLVVSSFMADSEDNNYCLRVDNRSQQAAEDGDLVLQDVIFACADKTNGGSLPGGTTVEAWASVNGAQFATITVMADPTANADTELQLLEGTPAIFSTDFATSLVDGAALTTGGAPAYVGALSQGADNWTANWAYGIYDGNRAEPLWFE